MGTGCSFDSAHRHTRLGAWARAASPTNPNHWPNLALLASYPYWNGQDRRLSNHLASNKKYAGNAGARNGDAVSFTLAALPVLPYAFELFRGEDSSNANALLEIAVESTVTNMLLTTGLKRLARRDRPNDNAGIGGRDKPSNQSFPSGHVSGAMTGAALVGRWLREQSPWFVPAEIALYGGVTYVAITRVEHDKHWPTDVVFSAFMAHWIVNTIWDAHHGRDDHEGIFDRLPKPIPVPMEDGVGVMFGVDF